MYEFLAKSFWFWADPARAVPALIVVGAMLLWSRWRATGRALVSVGAAILFAVATLPLGRWMAEPLEQRYAPFDPGAVESVDGIIVLGAGSAITSKLTGRPVVEASGERLVKMMELAARYPNARLVFTGGGFPLPNDPRNEAEVARDDLAGLHFDVGRLVLEDKALNTFENALLSKRLMQPKPGERWLLITSAVHMARSLASFRGQGWDVIPVPVEYIFPPGIPFDVTFEPLRRFSAVSRVSHEWIGLMAYRALGRTADLLPPPRAPQR